MVTKASIKPANLSQGFYFMRNRTAKLIKEEKLVINPLNVMITRNQDEENPEVKDENQFLEFKEKILTRDENEKEKGKLTGLDGDFKGSDAGEGKIKKEQGLLPGLQLTWLTITAYQNRSNRLYNNEKGM